MIQSRWEVAVKVRKEHQIVACIICGILKNRHMYIINTA